VFAQQKITMAKNNVRYLYA